MQEYAEILIIDDEPEMITYAGSILRKKGYRVSAVTNADSVFDYLRTHSPDLIILDIYLNGMNGIDICRTLKKHPETSDIPVIFMTADNNPETIKHGFNAGGCDYITKPFTTGEYLARIKTHINISRNAHELSAVNLELKQFCSAVSHDLKSPLNVLNMLIASLDDELGDNKNETITEIMKMIQEKSHKLVIMIERLLEFSKMCNVVPEIEKTDVNEITERIFSELKSLEPERNIQLKAENLPIINGDSVLLEMLFKNIISNAVKFTKCRETAEITVKSEETPQYTVITVKDNGAGFDMQYADKLFQVFQRLHTDDEYEGTGVGLALSDRIMRRHGGKIEAYGETDKGAEIKLFFKK